MIIILLQFISVFLFLFFTCFFCIRKSCYSHLLIYLTYHRHYYSFHGYSCSDGDGTSTNGHVRDSTELTPQICRLSGRDRMFYLCQYYHPCGDTRDTSQLSVRNLTSICVCLSFSLPFTQTLSLSLSQSHTHPHTDTHSHKISLSHTNILTLSLALTHSNNIALNRSGGKIWMHHQWLSVTITYLLTQNGWTH